MQQFLSDAENQEVNRVRLFPTSGPHERFCLCYGKEEGEKLTVHRLNPIIYKVNFRLNCSDKCILIYSYPDYIKLHFHTLGHI